MLPPSNRRDWFRKSALLAAGGAFASSLVGVGRADAAARNASGATAMECPNFLLIAKIAPLPPASPYTISNEGKIVPLTNPTTTGQQGDPNSNVMDSLEGIHLMDWATPQPLTRDPFDSNSPSSNESDPKASSSKSVAAPASGEAKKDDHQKPQSTSSAEAASTAADSRERLSEIDLRYLANQNRLLLNYVVQNQETEQHESPVPAAAASHSSDIE